MQKFCECAKFECGKLHPELHPSGAWQLRLRSKITKQVKQPTLAWYSLLLLLICRADLVAAAVLRKDEFVLRIPNQSQAALAELTASKPHGECVHPCIMSDKTPYP